MNSTEEIKRIILEGTKEEKLALFSFDTSMPVEKILLKFNLFTNAYFIRYLKNKSAPFHNEMITNLIRAYKGENFINLAFRGSAKSSYAKLFITFVLLNDEKHYRRYLKILSRDLKNPKQIVTDVYNMCLELTWLYGDVFEKEGDKKREETMQSFTMKCGVKLTAGTVGQAQRGHLQDAYRPDLIFFDDIEDSDSITSTVITQGIISSCEEAITGLQPIIGNWIVLGNYISEDGVIQWFINKTSRTLQITPIWRDRVPTWDIYSVQQIEALKRDSMNFAGEYECLKPDTLIKTEKGLVEIQKLKVGDMVWTHVGRLQPILTIFENEAEDLLDITVENKVTTITKNHPVLVKAGENRVGWKKAGQLTLDDLIVVIPHSKL